MRDVHVSCRGVGTVAVLFVNPCPGVPCFLFRVGELVCFRSEGVY